MTSSDAPYELEDALTRAAAGLYPAEAAVRLLVDRTGVGAPRAVTCSANLPALLRTHAPNRPPGDSPGRRNQAEGAAKQRTTCRHNIPRT